jgi:adenylyltransferase/sulfurtransferase
MSTERYIRQSTLVQIGATGQQRIGAACVAIIGLGSLGSVAAELLVRAGVGFIRIVDRDYVSLNNLQRSALYIEQDATDSLPKAIAAEQHLAAINSEVAIDAITADVNAETVEPLIADVDLILDATDNYATRALLNEACHKHNKTWIYAGALGTIGSLMVIPPSGPCLRCLAPTIPAPGSYPTCASTGVLATTTQTVAALQATTALKIITGEPAPHGKYISLDVWEMSLDEVAVERNPDCSCCAKGNYEFLNQPQVATSTELCGRDEYQVRPATKQDLDLAQIGERLRVQGAVTVSPFILTFDNGFVRIKLFKDGRAMLKGAKTPEAALSLYSDYIGL